MLLRNVSLYSILSIIFQLSNGEIRGESSASLLSNQEESSYGTGKGDLPSFQDDSDDDIIL